MPSQSTTQLRATHKLAEAKAWADYKLTEGPAWTAYKAISDAAMEDYRKAVAPTFAAAYGKKE